MTFRVAVQILRAFTTAYENGEIPASMQDHAANLLHACLNTADQQNLIYFWENL